MTFSTRSKTPLLWAALASSPLLLAGCFVVEDTALNRLVPKPADVDAGTLPTSETCGDPSAINVMAGVYSVGQGNGIDTRTANNDVNPNLCGAALPGGAPGPEVFVQFAAEAAQYWHFHVHPNNPAPADGGTAIVADPVLLLYQVQNSSCNTSNCMYVSNRCPAGGDEHFGLEIPASGEWALGIDNAIATGSLYDVTVFRPLCGNNPNPGAGDGPPEKVWNSDPEHGEGCDDGNVTPLDGCDDKCRVEIFSASGGEAEPNDDRFWANHVIVNAANTTLTPFLLTGMHGVCDTDTYMVRVTSGQHLVVRIKNASGTTYFTPAELEQLYGLEVRTASGTVVGSVTSDTALATLGKAVIDVTTAAASTDYYIFVTPPADATADGLRSYRIELDVN